MMDKIALLRRVLRQTVILAGLTGLMVAAGIDWAHAATHGAGNAMPSVPHVIVLFLATIAFVICATMPARKPARARARRSGRR